MALVTHNSILYSLDSHSFIIFRLGDICSMVSILVSFQKQKLYPI